MEITRRLEFDAGHRLIGHESKCANLHGHRYVVEITCSARGLDEVGRIIDFGVIKEVMGDWIMDNWDHNMILNPDDPLIQLYNYANEDDEDRAGGVHWVNSILMIFGGKDPYIMPKELANPTAENMATHLLDITTKLLEGRRSTFHDTLKVVRIRLYETPNCYAEAVPYA